MISYSSVLLNKVFQCKCGYPLLMFGCNNSNCDNYYIKRIKEEKPKTRRVEKNEKEKQN